MAIAGKVAITPKGEWNAQIAYTKLDLVFYDNASYVAIQPSTGVTPTNTAYWMLVLQSENKADIQKIINGETKVGDADKLDGHHSSYFAKDSDLAIERERITNLATLTEGSTTGDAELIDARVGENGVTYDSVGEAVRTQFANVKSDLSEKAYKAEMDKYDEIFDFGNLFNNEAITENVYVNTGNGNLVEDGSNTFYASDFINVTGIDVLTLSYTHVACWYDENKNFISVVGDMNSRTEDKKVSVPSNAIYIRFSGFKTEKSIAQVGENISRNDYIPYGARKINGLVVKEQPKIIVAVDGSGDYWSLTEALYKTTGDIVVKQGIYNIVNEYKKLFGDTVFDTLSDKTELNMFQYGLFVHERKIEFESGVWVTADFTGITVDSTHRLCAFNLGRNAHIKGLVCYGVNCFYLIHDDWYNNNEAYTNIIEDCILKMSNPVNKNIIGGGAGKYSTKIVRNCYMDNGLDVDTVTLRYHNIDVDGAIPTVSIENCYVNGSIGIRWWGDQTATKMIAKVFNCSMGSEIAFGGESGSTIENVTLYEWNNTIRN